MVVEMIQRGTRASGEAAGQWQELDATAAVRALWPRSGHAPEVFDEMPKHVRLLQLSLFLAG